MTMEIIFGIGCVALLVVTMYLIHRERRNL